MRNMKARVALMKRTIEEKFDPLHIRDALSKNVEITRDLEDLNKKLRGRKVLLLFLLLFVELEINIVAV